MKQSALMGRALLLLTWAGIAFPQSGQTLYQTHCAGCHEAAQGRTPPVSALRAMSAPKILDVLNNGIMKMQAATLTPENRAAVAAFLGTAATLSPMATNACTGIALTASRYSIAGGWSSWGLDTANTRFQTEKAAGLTAAQVPRLKLKWAFNLGADAEPRSQPAVLHGTIYVGAAKLYALDTLSGCTKWEFSGDAPVRSGVMVGPGLGDEPTVFFGDYKANIYAVSASAGKLLWKVHIDANFAAMVTGTPVLYKGLLYVGTSSFEEVMAASPKYRCCSFRGSVVALNVTTGAQIWKTYTIDVPSHEIAGTTFRGPSGAGVWSSPTIDEKLQRVYVATGDNYSEPATQMSDGVLAMELATGKLLWSRQATAGDIYNTGCDPGVHGACPETHGYDFDFGQPPVLIDLRNGARALVIGQKSGMVHAFDPDANGNPMWSTRIGEGGALGGIQWGSAAHDGRFYVALSDLRLGGVPDRNAKSGYRLEANSTKGGGLFTLDVSSGKIVWNAKPAPCGERRPCSPAQSAAVSGIPGVIFSGSLDGHVRAYAIETGRVIWDGDTEHEFTTVSGQKAHGGSLDVAGPVIAQGAVYVMSGYGKYGGAPGTVLLAYTLDGQ